MQEHLRWLVEPLVAAGLEVDEIRALVTRLASGAAAADLVADRAPEVRAAWTEMIGRMLS